MKAIWNGEIIAESDDTVVVEGNHYFPADSTRPVHLRPSATTTVCPWKGTAHYYDVVVDEQVNRDAASDLAGGVLRLGVVPGRVAFWRGVGVG